MLLIFAKGNHRASVEADSVSVLSWADGVEKKASKKAEREAIVCKRRAEKRLTEVQQYLNLMSTDEMILILKIEDFLTKHTYIGRHWMGVLKRLADKYKRV